MHRVTFPGGWYCDNLPSGAYAVQIPGSHFVTHAGDVPFPVMERGGYGPLFVRITEIGAFRLAGKGHSTTATWEHWPHGWSAEADGIGISPHIYDNFGSLIISPITYGYVGSQGYRYCDADNRLWTGDETYLSPHGVSEYTDIGSGIEIGQGHSVGGVVVWIDGVLRRLESGACYTVRAHRVGDDVSIAFWRDAPRESVLIWTTIAELRALPPVAPNPPDPPVEPPIMIPNLLPKLQTLRATYPAMMTMDECVDLINRTAWGEPGFGLLAKPAGTNGVQPGSGIRCSVDWLVYRPEGRGGDVLIAAPNIETPLAPATPTWFGAGDPFDVSKFVAPTPPAGVPPVNPPPVDPPPSDDLQRQIDALKAENAAQTARLNALASDLAALSGRAVQYGQRVGLRTDNGHVVCAEGGGGGDVNATRTAVGGGKTFVPERG